jgi:hypothetical protein
MNQSGPHDSHLVTTQHIRDRLFDGRIREQGHATYRCIYNYHRTRYFLDGVWSERKA